MFTENNFKIIKRNNNYFLENSKYKNKFLLFKYFISKQNLHILFKNLQKFKLKLLSEKELKDHKINDNIIYYEKKKMVIKQLYNDYYYLNKITDYFSEKCRIQCKFANFNSPDDSYKKNKYYILKYAYNKYGYINNRIIYDYFFTSKYKTLPCNNFNVSIMMSLLKIFKPTNMLDFSAGWGDRLIGAIAYNTKYTGVDPSNCMYEIYLKIINTLAKEPSNYKIINKGFENTDLTDNIYDFIFTSPPFFTYEVYEKNNINQSISKFNNLKSWENNFLYPSLEKCIKHLAINKYIALYISDFKNNKYVDNMLNFMEEKKNIKYSGIIYFYNYDTNKKLRKIYVWKKI